MNFQQAAANRQCNRLSRRLSRQKRRESRSGSMRKPAFLFATLACGVAICSASFARENQPRAHHPTEMGSSLASGHGSSLATQEEQFAGHMAAGEFQLARELAVDSTNPALRDTRLSELARHQARHGALNRSIETASYIGSDETRSSTLSELGNPFSGSGGARGGGIVADFDPLMDLITNTIAVDSWEEVGGPGNMEPFAAGVHVDPQGTLRKLDRGTDASWLAELRDKAARKEGDAYWRDSSELRMVSINRLEKEVQLRAARGLEPTESMRNLVGLYQIDYLFLYPESGDIVLAGPAGDWHYDAEGRPLNVKTNRPVLQLEDLVACLRSAQAHDGIFGCSIDPKPENLKRTQEYLASSKLKGAAWREGLREALGQQKITIHGIDPRSHAAHVLIEADYRMKLVGIGLEDGTFGVESYLDMVGLDENGNPPPMDVVRWWFAMNYDAVVSTADRNAFRFEGPGVKVLSESEFLDEEGDRIRRGKSTAPTARFAESFTKHFDQLSSKYPIYADLKNVFDLSLAATLIESNDWPSQVDWHLTHFGLPGQHSGAFDTSVAVAPKEVATVLNHREIETRQGRKRLKHTIVAVSGGVVGNAQSLVSRDNIEIDSSGSVETMSVQQRPAGLEHHDWWWDD